MNLNVFFTSIILSFIVAPLVQKAFLIYKKYDPINHRSSHSVVATRTGGITSFIVIFFISLYFYLLGTEIYDYSLLVPIGTIFVVGVYDDFYNADFKLKFLFQIIVAKMLIDQGLVIDNFYGIFNLHEIPRIGSQLFTIFVYIIIVNSINFIDGVDGLAILEIIKIILIFILFTNQDPSLNLLGIITLGSILPLYYFNNKKKDKVFLGDGGSLFLGTIVCVFIFNFLNSDFKFNISFNKPLFSILILLYPLVDLLRVFIIRLSQKKSPFQPDKSHLHHILIKKNVKHWIIAIVLPICFLLISSFIFILMKV